MTRPTRPRIRRRAPERIPRTIATSSALIITLGLAACTSPDGSGRPTPSPPSTSSAPAAPPTSEPAMDYARLLQLAEAFQTSLTDGQRADLVHPYTFENAARWHTYPQWYLGDRGRLGVDLGSLDQPQWDALNNLLVAVTGTGHSNGYDQIQQHLTADDYLHSVGAGDGYGRGDFRVAFLGAPSETGRWQLQFGGHHLAVNNTYENGTLIGATPSFRAIEPMTFEYGGVQYRPEGREWDAFVALLASLTPEQSAAARLPQAQRELLLAPGTDWAFPDTPSGIPVASLDEAQRQLVWEAIVNYVDDVDDVSAAAYLEKYTAELDQTHLAFSGSPSLTETGDYVRIDGPTLWLELSMDPPYTSDEAHPHAVWRDKQDDYGGARP